MRRPARRWPLKKPLILPTNLGAKGYTLTTIFVLVVALVAGRLPVYVSLPLLAASVLLLFDLITIAVIRGPPVAGEEEEKSGGEGEGELE